MRRTVFLVVLVAFFSSGCQTVKGWLRPWVCECASSNTPVMEGHPDLHDHGEDEHAEEDDLDPQTTQPDAPEPPEMAEADEASLQPAMLTWIKPIDITSQEERDRVKNSFIVRGEIDESRTFIEGSFSPKAQAEVAIVEPGRSIEIFSDSARVARTPFALSPAPEQFGAFVVATELVSDGRQELVFTGVQTDIEGQRTVSVSVWKVIGGAVAQIFERPIAVEVNGTWQPVGRVRFLVGQKHRFLEYTPMVGDSKDEPQVFRWNRWEGMFRIPTPVPTAPLRAWGPFPEHRVLVTTNWIR